ncbi:hypothetical protein LTR28_001818 [Elasticomyces elasticus]|nr:hypothetical protein LTR28_001818 [Elasticomyces elasticus]
MTGQSLGFCLPMDLDRLFSIRSWGPASDAGYIPSTKLTISTTDSDPVNADILKSVVRLGNTVLSNKAAADLNALRLKKAPGFQQPALFHKVMGILAAHHYRLPACRFVIDLFDKSVMKSIVLEEEGSSAEGSGSQDGAGV